MRRLLPIILLLCCLLPTVAAALDVPPLKGRVNDYAGLLTPATAQRLEQFLADFEGSDSTQVVFLSVPSLEGDSLEEFSIRVAEAWQIGRGGRDNGAILLVAKAERKVRIEVGRGLEGRLTDLVSGRIIRGEIAPRFKAGDLDGGVTAGLEAMVAASRGEYQATAPDLRHGRKGFNPALTLLLFLGVGCIFLGSLSRLLGGLAGAAGLPFIAFLTLPTVGLVLLVALAVIGFGAGLGIAALFAGGRGVGGGPFIMGGGGGYGGGFSGGFGGGGGFSGGGGSFGGGGASGDW